MILHKYNFYKPDSILKKLLKIDWVLLFLVSIVCIIGVGTLYSAGNGNLNPWALNHLYKIIIGFLIVFILSQFKINFIVKFSIILYAFCIFCLVYVIYFGVGDVKRWIDLKYFFFSTIRINKNIYNFIISKIF